MTWTAEANELLKMRADAGWSASQIARDLDGIIPGVSRNAVIGKCHRKGIALTGSPGFLPGVPRAPRAPVPREPRTTVSVALCPTAPFPRIGKGVRIRSQKQAHLVERKHIGERDLPWITLAKLRSGLCKFPKGTPGKDDFAYCGAAAHPDRPYCPYHCSIAYVAPRARREGVIR